MQVSRVSQGAYNASNLNKSNINFKAKLIVTDDVKVFLGEKALEIGNAVASDDLQAIIIARQIGRDIREHLDSLAKSVEDIPPKDFPIKYDLSDEYKAFKETGGQHSEFDAQYNKIFELRFGTEEDQKRLRREGGRADFNMYLDAMDAHMKQLASAIKSRMVLFQNK